MRRPIPTDGQRKILYAASRDGPHGSFAKAPHVCKNSLECESHLVRARGPTRHLVRRLPPGPRANHLEMRRSSRSARRWRGAPAICDYSAVRALVAELVTEGVGATALPDHPPHGSGGQRAPEMRRYKA